MATTDTTPALPLSPGARVDHVSAHAHASPDRPHRGARNGSLRPGWRGAHRRGASGGAVLRRQGRSDRDRPAIRRRRVDCCRPSAGSVHGGSQPAPRTGGSLFRARASEAGEAIELDRKQLLSLVQTDAELSEILMRAFILRRVELLAKDSGNVVVIGSNHCAGTLGVREFLSQTGIRTTTSISIRMPTFKRCSTSFRSQRTTFQS